MGVNNNNNKNVDEYLDVRGKRNEQERGTLNKKSNKRKT